MSAISGLSLYPTKQIIKHTKLIAIANKESIFVLGIYLKKFYKKIKQNLSQWTQSIFHMVCFKRD